MKLIIHATSIHVGGGKSLLLALLGALPEDLSVLALLDARLELSGRISSNLTAIHIAPTIAARLGAEKKLAQLAKGEDIVLCFSNLPPLFKVAGRVIVFVQNRYLVDKVSLADFAWKTRLRLLCERWWLAFKASNADEFVVQTPSMKRILIDSRRSCDSPIHVLPFIHNSQGYSRNIQSKQPKIPLPAFIYVASSEPHKNHRNLIHAWCLLAEEGIFPILRLTISPNTNHEFCKWLQSQTELFQLKIENLGFLSNSQVKAQYELAQVLIFPSTLESFGLPLIEARQAGLAVLASEMEYVRDVVDPEESFDPSSPVSIAQAVKRFLGVESKALPLLNAQAFLTTILKLNP